MRPRPTRSTRTDTRVPYAALVRSRRAAVHGDEAGAEALDAGIVLVAVALVDLALAPELGVLRQHAHAERLLPAVAAALAHQRVDEHALGRVDHLAALAAAALLGGAGLVVDEDAHALHFAQALLHGVQLAAVEELDVIWKDRAVRPLPDFVAQHTSELQSTRLNSSH